MDEEHSRMVDVMLRRAERDAHRFRVDMFYREAERDAQLAYILWKVIGCESNTPDKPVTSKVDLLIGVSIGLSISVITIALATMLS